MASTSNIRDNIDKKKSRMSSEEELREMFNDTSVRLVKKFLADALAGDIPMESTADLTRLMQIYTQINNINMGADGVQGTLPEISLAQKEAFSDNLTVTKGVSAEGDEVDLIDLDELAELDAEEIDNMLITREAIINKENEGAF